MSESMKAQVTSTNQDGYSYVHPEPDTVTTTYNPGLTMLEDKEPEEYKYVHVVIGILVLMIIGAFFIGGMFVENKMMKIQIEVIGNIYENGELLKESNDHL